MTMREIDDIHRKQNGEVIVLFSDRTARDNLFNKRRTPELEALTPSAFEHWPAPQRGNKFYLNESLTMDRSKAAAICRRKAKQMNSLQNRVGESAIKIGSREGVLTVNKKLRDGQTRILKFTTVEEFDSIYPNDIDIIF